MRSKFLFDFVRRLFSSRLFSLSYFISRKEVFKVLGVSQNWVAHAVMAAILSFTYRKRSHFVSSFFFSPLRLLRQPFVPWVTDWESKL